MLVCPFRNELEFTQELLDLCVRPKWKVVVRDVKSGRDRRRPLLKKCSERPLSGTSCQIERS